MLDIEFYKTMLLISILTQAFKCAQYKKIIRELMTETDQHLISEQE